MSESSLFPGAFDSTNLYEVVARLSTTLTADITAATTTIPLASTTGFPTQGYIVIDNETIAYISVSVGSVDATGGRGHAGTAASHTSTTQVLVAVTAAVFNKLRAGLIAVQTDLGITGAKTYTPISGWIATGTSTYVSSVTMTVSNILAYQKGDKVRYKQGGAYKYGYVYSMDVPNNALYITGGSDYTVVSAAITDMAYSHIENPLGFPQYFNYVPNLTGGNTDLPGYNWAKFMIKGTSVFVEFSASNKTLSGTAGTIIITMPVACVVGQDSLESITIQNGTAYVNTLAELLSGSSNYYIWKTINAGDWVANEAGVNISFKVVYQF